MGSSNLIELIKEAGVVGAGGAGFPTHRKLVRGIDYLLINGAECEPLLQVDKNISKEFARELVETLEKLLISLNIKQGIFGLIETYTEGINEIEKAIAGRENIRIHKLPDIYPSGDEIVFIYECTGRI